MTPKDSSDEKQVWPKRSPDQRQLFASVDKWLACLPYLSKPELDKCREVCEWTNRLIEKHSGGQLKQRRQLHQLDIDQMTPLDMGKWMEDEGEMVKIKAKAKQLIGEMVYLHRSEDMTVRISIVPQLGQCFYLDVKNLLDEKDALLIARLMPRITQTTAVFRHTNLTIGYTPELPTDAPHGGSYFNSAVFSLPCNADGSGGGPAKFITQHLSLVGPLVGFSPQGMIQTAERTVQCQELFPVYFPPALHEVLRLFAVARPLNAPAWIDAHAMGNGRLDEILNFFTDTVPGFESTVPRLRVTIRNTAAWPESLPTESAINPREEQLAERLYKFRRYNHETGEKLEVTVRGSIVGYWDFRGMVMGREQYCLRVAEMVLHFRPDDTDK